MQLPGVSGPPNSLGFSVPQTHAPLTPATSSAHKSLLSREASSPPPALPPVSKVTNLCLSQPPGLPAPVPWLGAPTAGTAQAWGRRPRLLPPDPPGSSRLSPPQAPPTQTAALLPAPGHAGCPRAGLSIPAPASPITAAQAPLGPLPPSDMPRHARRLGSPLRGPGRHCRGARWDRFGLHPQPGSDSILPGSVLPRMSWCLRGESGVGRAGPGLSRVGVALGPWEEMPRWHQPDVPGEDSEKRDPGRGHDPRKGPVAAGGRALGVQCTGQWAQHPASTVQMSGVWAAEAGPLPSPLLPIGHSQWLRFRHLVWQEGRSHLRSCWVGVTAPLPSGSGSAWVPGPGGEGRGGPQSALWPPGPGACSQSQPRPALHRPNRNWVQPGLGWGVQPVDWVSGARDTHALLSRRGEQGEGWGAGGRVGCRGRRGEQGEGWGAG